MAELRSSPEQTEYFEAPLKTEFCVDTKDFYPDVINDIGQMYMNMTGKIMVHDRCEGTVHKFIIHEDVDPQIFMKYIQDNHTSCKAKRLEKMQTVDCRVIRYAGQYYILDGETKIPLFE